MITLQNADAALKDYYLNAVSAQLGQVSPFFAQVEKTAENVYGKDVKMAIVKGNANSVVAGDEDGDLPDPYSNRYYSVTMPLKNIYGTIEISDKALRASRDSSGAFVNLLNAEMEGLVASAKENFSRMLFSDGDGFLCKITQKTSSTVFTVDSVKTFYVGLKVDIYSGETALAVGTTITAIDKKAKTITVSAPISAEVVGASVCYAGSKGKEIKGLLSLFNGETVYGYNKQQEPYFNAQKITASGAITESDLVEIIDGLAEDADSKVDMILCSYSSRKAIASLVEDSRRIINTTDVNAGYGGVFVSGVPVIAEKYCPENMIFFVNSKDFSLNQLCDWEWLEDEDGKILKQVSGKPAYGATLVKYAELICKKPCGQAVLITG